MNQERISADLTGEAAIVVGLGEMGGVFSRALLRAGHPVFPVVRGADQGTIARHLPHPVITLVTVGEADLDLALEHLPRTWHSTVGLVQNELLPRDWRRHGLATPTVAVVWFEKKPGQDVKVIMPTPIAGPAAAALVNALATIDVPAREVDGGDGLLFELVAKNLYILTANIAGLDTGGTVSELWRDHRPLAAAVAGEVLSIQQWLSGIDLDEGRLIDAMVGAFAADPDHKTTGRSAPARLARALDHAGEAGLSVPHLHAIAQRHGVGA